MKTWTIWIRCISWSCISFLIMAFFYFPKGPSLLTTMWWFFRHVFWRQLLHLHLVDFYNTCSVGKYTIHGIRMGVSFSWYIHSLSIIMEKIQNFWWVKSPRNRSWRWTLWRNSRKAMVLASSLAQSHRGDFKSPRKLFSLHVNGCLRNGCKWLANGL